MWGFERAFQVDMAGEIYILSSIHVHICQTLTKSIVCYVVMYILQIVHHLCCLIAFLLSYNFHVHTFLYVYTLYINCTATIVHSCSLC